MVLVAVYHILVLVVLHFTRVDHVVIAINQEINLHPLVVFVLGLMRPRMSLADDCRETERLLDLIQVLEADSFKGQTCPGVMDRG